MNKLLFVLPFLLLLGCKIFDKPAANELPPNATSLDLKVELECYNNAMPMAGGSAYVIITATPIDGTVQENLKVKEMKAVGENGTWTASVFDVPDFTGKGNKTYHNTARNFDPTIGSQNDFTLILKNASGQTQTFEIKGVKIQTVY